MNKKSKYQRPVKKQQEQIFISRKENNNIKKTGSDFFTDNSSKKNLYIFSSLVLGITFITFLPSLFCGFTNLDDQYYILDIPYIKGLSFKIIRTLFSNFYVGNYEPLAMLSLCN